MINVGHYYGIMNKTRIPRNNKLRYSYAQLGAFIYTEYIYSLLLPLFFYFSQTHTLIPASWLLPVPCLRGANRGFGLHVASQFTNIDPGINIFSQQ